MLRTLTLLSLLTAPLFALAQVATPQDFTAGKITFNHPGDFTQQQLEDAAGLHVGSTFTVDDLTKAAQKLADTGYFDNIGATVDGPIKSTTVLFDITPIDLSCICRLE